MHARMNTSCTIRHGRHARLMCSQAAGRQWSSQTMDIYGWTSRGQLHMVVVHDVVQWLPSLCRMCRPRTIARSTSLSACSARVVRSRHLRLSRASRGFRDCSSASETDSGCTAAKVVAAGRSAAVFIRSLRSRQNQKVSLFRLSGAATRRDPTCDQEQHRRARQARVARSRTTTVRQVGLCPV